MTSFNFNSGQQAAADGFFEFLLSDEKEMKISGPGGVGKSYMISGLVDDVMPKYEQICRMMGQDARFKDVHMTSLTNKASEVLSVFTQRPVQTVHSFMNLKVVDDYKTGRSRVEKVVGAWKVHEQIILFVDEYTMTDSQLDQLVQEGTHQCKIVYIGDHCQMAPVMEKQSPIDRRQMRTYHLTEQMRTNIPEIQALHQQLRETVETGVFKPIKIIPGIIDHLNDQQMEDMLRQTFSKQTLDSRILCYTNKRVGLYNDFIREVRGLPAEYTIGELLINSSAIRLKNSMLSVEEEVEITNFGPEYDIEVAKDINGSPVMLRLSNATLRCRSGAEHTDVPLPSDRAHFAALVNHFKRHKEWHSYYGLRNKYPDLRQRDAATVYKAQGSTYQTGFIDLTDISTCTHTDQVARMLYVGCSRERERIFLYGNLADKYGGLIH